MSHKKKHAEPAATDAEFQIVPQYRHRDTGALHDAEVFDGTNREAIEVLVGRALRFTDPGEGEHESDPRVLFIPEPPDGAERTCRVGDVVVIGDGIGDPGYDHAQVLSAGEFNAAYERFDPEASPYNPPVDDATSASEDPPTA